MPQFNGDVIFLDGSGQVRATNGSLTLRGDDTGTKAVIVGSGMAFRPETDVRIDLGRPDLRWHKTYTGYIESLSGILGDNQPAGNKLEFDQNNFHWQTASVEFDSSTVDFVNAQLILDSSSQLIGNGFLDVLGTFRVRTDVDAVDGDISHRIGSPTSRFGYVYAGSGIFNALRPYTSGTFINVEGSLLPSRDALYSLGTSSSRWGTAHVASGIFNTIDAPVSGTFIHSAASIVPNRHNIYSLGTNTQRWANLFAASGTVDTLNSSAIVSTTLVADAIQANTTIFSLGSVLALSDISSLGTIGAAGITTFGGPVFLSSVTGPTVDAGNTSIGVQGLRMGYVYAVSGFIETISPIASGSFTIINGSFVPDLTNMRSLGTDSLRWANIFATSGEFTTLKTKGVDVPNKREAVTVVHAIGASGAHINTTQVRDIYNYTIPANTLTPSGRLKLEIFGTITNQSAAGVNFTPILAINGSNIYGDILSVAAAARPGRFEFVMDVLALGSMTGNHICGRAGLGNRTAGTIRGVGNFGAADPDCLWLQDITAGSSGTVDFSAPVNVRVSMTMGTASTLVSYSGLYAQLVHYPFPGV